MPGPAGQFPSIYATLKGLDPANTAAFVAAALQAMEWDAAHVAAFCGLINADPKEVDNINRQARAAAESGVPGAAWLPHLGV